MKFLLYPFISLTLLAPPAPRDAAHSTVDAIRRAGDIAPGKVDAIVRSMKEADDLAATDPAGADGMYRLVVMQGELLLAPPTPEQPAPSPPKAVPAPVPDAAPAAPPDEESAAPVGTVVEAETIHTVGKGETIADVSARYGMPVEKIIRKNRLSRGKALKEGQRLRVVARRIAPKVLRDGIVVNIPERTLYYFRKGSLSLTTPISVGKPRKPKGEVWETPTGEFRILGRVKDPVWTIPKSIQEEMAQQGKVLETVEVPPGPANPLGKHALKTSIPSILIHGTNSRNSIHRFSSHGCIRVPPEEMEKLYLTVPLQTHGEIIYAPVKVASTTDGHVLVEVHRDAYGKAGNLEAAVRRQLSDLGLEEMVDWDKVRAAVKRRAGVAEDVTLTEPAAGEEMLAHRSN